MNRKSVGAAAMLVVVTMGIASMVAGVMLPADVQLPYHWALDGEPDGLTGKWTALLLAPATIGAVSLLFYFMPTIEPRREGLARSQGLYLWGWVGLLLVGAMMEVVLLSAGFGWGLPVNRLLVGAVAVMLVMIGNQLGKSRSMFLIGLRTPWTLSSEEVWIKTHRLCGKLMVVGGLAMLAAALLPLPVSALVGITIGVIAVSAGVPIVYSYIAWRRETRQARG